MSLYAVVREAGPGWTEGKSAFDQAGVDEHASFMNELADEGFVLYAGPLAGSERGRIRALVILDAPNGEELHRRLAEDPWARTDRIVTSSVEPWTLFVGTDQLPDKAKP
jgi:uncharacterized protein YciI